MNAFYLKMLSGFLVSGSLSLNSDSQIYFCMCSSLLSLVITDLNRFPALCSLQTGCFWDFWCYEVAGSFTAGGGDGGGFLFLLHYINMSTLSQLWCNFKGIKGFCVIIMGYADIFYIYPFCSVGETRLMFLCLIKCIYLVHFKCV